MEWDPRLPRLRINREELKRVLINLLQNAVQALPGGGRITVRGLAGARFVRLEVSDTGPGIPPEVQARLFQPSFSTKSEGMGLGLAICRRAIEGRGGTITVTSGPGQGTTVAVNLPV